MSPRYCFALRLLRVVRVVGDGGGGEVYTVNSFQPWNPICLLHVNLNIKIEAEFCSHSNRRVGTQEILVVIPTSLDDCEVVGHYG